jgi:diguanylate cyclase (GGDEF)-like protein
MNLSMHSQSLWLKEQPGREFEFTLKSSYSICMNERVRRTYSDLVIRSTFGGFAYIAGWIGLLIFTDMLENRALFAWAGFVVIALSGALRFYVKSRFECLFDTKPRLWLLLFYSAIFSAAIVWASALFMAFAYDWELFSQILLLVTATALSSGAITSFAPLKSFGIIYSTLLLAPINIYILIFDLPNFGIGYMLVIYQLFLILTVFKQNNEYWQARKNEIILVEQNAELERLSRIDALTQINNRSSFDETFQKEWKRAKRSTITLCLLLIDIDHFKKINDQYGHLCGDEVLRTVSELIKSAVKRENDFAARYGGEEFALLLPSTQPLGAVQVAERLREIIELAEFQYESSVLQLTISIGVAAFHPELTEDLRDLLHQADKALYYAKEHGRNMVHRYEPGVTEPASS